MHIFNEIKHCCEKVKFLLQTYKECRDDDKRLLAYYQWYALRLWEFNITKEAFFERTRFAELPAAESITRARRKVQEKNHDLLGEKQRQRLAEARYISANINIL